MLSACLMLTACEIQNPVEIPEAPASSGVSSGSSFGDSFKDSVMFSATLGADTKTYMESYGSGVYELLWSEGDNIVIWDGNTLADGENAMFEQCGIYEGAGTSSATFFGTLETDIYVALYADTHYLPENGCPCILLPQEQYGVRTNSFNDFTYPMIAVSTTRELQFENICSVLKLNVTGDGERIRSITAYSQAGEPMSGLVTVDIDMESFEPFISFLGEGESDDVYSWVDLNCYDATLSSYPTEFYIVVPAQVYEEGIGFTLVTDQGKIMDVTTAAGIETKRSQVHEIDITFESTGDYNTWGLIGTMTEWSSDIEMTKADDYGWLLVNQYLEEGDEFKFRANGEWLLEFGYYNLTILYTEEGVEWFGQGTDSNGNLRALQSGYYDLLLNPDNATLIVDLVGVEESFYGTIEESTK